ncbi:MAG: hypothetical protein ACYTGH_22050, partial [Planctomycetota bacterium]
MSEANTAPKRSSSVASKMMGNTLLCILWVIALLAIATYYGVEVRRGWDYNERISTLVKRMQSVQILEKRYLQFHDSGDEQQMRAGCKKLKETLEALTYESQGDLQKRAKALKTDVENYAAEYDLLVSAYKVKTDKSNRMSKPLNEARTEISKLIAVMDSKQSSLQEEGDDLSNQELEVKALLKECAVLGWNLQSLQQDYLLDADEAQYEKRFSDVLEKAICLVALPQYARFLKDQQFTVSAKVICDGIDAFKANASSVTEAFKKEQVLEKSLDDKGKVVIRNAEEIHQEVAATSERLIKRALQVLGVCFVLGLVLFLFLSHL